MDEFPMASFTALEKKGISVKKLAENKAVDLRDMSACLDVGADTERGSGHPL